MNTRICCSRVLVNAVGIFVSLVDSRVSGEGLKEVLLKTKVSRMVWYQTLVSGPIRQLKCYYVSLAHTQHNTQITAHQISAGPITPIKPTGCREGPPRRGSPQSAACLLVHTASIWGGNRAVKVPGGYKVQLLSHLNINWYISSGVPSGAGIL